MTELKQKKITGIDRSLDPTPGSSYIVKNLSYSSRLGCWFKDRGYLAYTHPTPNKQTEDVYSLSTLQLKGSAKEFIISERDVAGDGTLTLEFISPRSSNGQVTLKTNRHKPTANDSGTSYVQYGDKLFIFNGYDKPLKYLGDRRIEEFSFSNYPATPQPFSPAEGNMNGATANDFIYASQLNSDKTDITVAVNKKNIIGLGEVGNLDPMAYAYRISFVTDTGSESPLSQPSRIVKWNNGYDSGSSENEYRYGIVLDNVDTGPDGTVKRRIYRTKNIKFGDQTDATYYFVDEIPNNCDTSYMDMTPDALLGSEAPADVDTGLFPIGSKYGASFQNRVIVGGGVHQPTTIWFSKTYEPESFPIINYIDVGQRFGGEITGFVPFNNLLIVFRRRAIEALIPTGDTTEPFYATPVATNVGCQSPKTAQIIPGVGLIFLGDDGFYLLNGNFTQGGQNISLNRISDSLQDYIQRINISALSRAVATYNANDEEYWCQIPIDGSTTPNIGFVFHQQILSWSIRENIPAQCFVELKEGFTLFGGNGNELELAAPVSWSVWCGHTSYGYAAGYNSFASGTPDAYISSAWLDFGDPTSIKKIKNITIYILSTTSTADVGITSNSAPGFKSYIDWDYSPINTNTIVSLDTQSKNTSLAKQPAYGLTNFGDSNWSNIRPSAIRYSVNVPACSQYRFEFGDFTKDIRMYILGYDIEFEVTDVKHIWSDTFKFSNSETIKFNGVPDALKPTIPGSNVTRI